MDWIEKLHQVGKQLRARFCTTKDLQRCAASRAKVVHRDTTPAIINQMLEVVKKSKRKFTLTAIRKTEKGGNDESSEHWVKRLKAFEERESITKQSEHAHILLSGFKSDSEAITMMGTTMATATANASGGEEGVESHKRVRVRSQRYDKY